jgi:hypothetical protein
VIGGIRLTPNAPYATGHRPNKGIRACDRSWWRGGGGAIPQSSVPREAARAVARGGKVESHTGAVVLDGKDGA